MQSSSSLPQDDEDHQDASGGGVQQRPPLVVLKGASPTSQHDQESLSTSQHLEQEQDQEQYTLTSDDKRGPTICTQEDLNHSRHSHPHISSIEKDKQKRPQTPPSLPLPQKDDEDNEKHEQGLSENVTVEGKENNGSTGGDIDQKLEAIPTEDNILSENSSIKSMSSFIGEKGEGRDTGGKSPKVELTLQQQIMLAENEKNHGRRGDPRMNRAVSKKLLDPNMSLFQALTAGGFQFPCDEENSIGFGPVYDKDNILLSQRKNQLSRRLRLLTRKSENILKLKKSRSTGKTPEDESDLGGGESISGSTSTHHDDVHQQEQPNIKHGKKRKSGVVNANSIPNDLPQDQLPFLAQQALPEGALGPLSSTFLQTQYNRNHPSNFTFHQLLHDNQILRSYLQRQSSDELLNNQRRRLNLDPLQQTSQGASLLMTQQQQNSLRNAEGPCSPFGNSYQNRLLPAAMMNNQHNMTGVGPPGASSLLFGARDRTPPIPPALLQHHQQHITSSPMIPTSPARQHMSMNLRKFSNDVGIKRALLNAGFKEDEITDELIVEFHEKFLEKVKQNQSGGGGTG